MDPGLLAGPACRPLIYSCLALATNRDVEDNRKHMISVFEQAIRLMPHAQQQARAQQQGQAEAQQQAPQQAEAGAAPQPEQAEDSEDEFATVASELCSQPSSEATLPELQAQLPVQQPLQPAQQAPAAQQAQQQGQQRPVESWCWVMDFHGFSIRDCDPRLAKVWAPPPLPGTSLPAAGGSVCTVPEPARHVAPSADAPR